MFAGHPSQPLIRCVTEHFLLLRMYVLMHDADKVLISSKHWCNAFLCPTLNQIPNLEHGHYHAVANLSLQSFLAHSQYFNIKTRKCAK